jgi:hypothetical protein
MASGTRIPKAEPTGNYGAMATRMARKLFGEVPGPLEMYWHTRTALANSMARGNTAMGIKSQEFSAACGLKPLSMASTA